MNKTICYIPLDDRPVCLKRVILLSKVCDFDIITPPLDLIKTGLDNQPKNTNGTNHGDYLKLSKWFKELNHQIIDYYLIAIDQILIGGLVNSRYDDSVLEHYQEIIDIYFDKSLICNKPVILIDSIMRLASTAGYMNYGYHEYHEIREYAKVARPVLIDDYSINDIINNYEFNQDNQIIDYNKYLKNSFDAESIKNHYLKVRSCKLKVTDYLMDYLIKGEYKNVYYMLGIDDSSPEITIQTNEIKYFKNKIKKMNGLVFVGIDELGLMGITNFAKRTYESDTYNKPTTVKLTYLGGMEKYPGNEYDDGTIEECVNAHLEVMNLLPVGESEDYQIDVIMLTYQKSDTEPQLDLTKTVRLVQELRAKNHQIILMDLSNWNHYGALEQELVKTDILGELLAYSNWNTTSNIVGISLSVGLARYYFMKSIYLQKKYFFNNVLKLSNKILESTLELVAYTYLKDMNYKAFAQKEIKMHLSDKTKDNLSYLNFYQAFSNTEIPFTNSDLLKITKESMENIINPCNNQLIIAALKRSNFLCAIINNKDYYLSIDYINIIDYIYPWYRTFELDIVIKGAFKNEFR